MRMAGRLPPGTDTTCIQAVVERTREVKRHAAAQYANHSKQDIAYYAGARERRNGWAALDCAREEGPAAELQSRLSHAARRIREARRLRRC